MTYKNYRIEPSKVSGYEAYNMLDCDEPMIICETVEEIVKIINEKDSDDENNYRICKCKNSCENLDCSVIKCKERQN